VHKAADVLDKLPKSVQPAAKAALREIWRAPDRASAEAAMATFAAKYAAKYEKAVACLAKDREALLAFYDFPAEHWDHLRTSNPIESVFATVRHRTVRTKGALSQGHLQVVRTGPGSLTGRGRRGSRVQAAAATPLMSAHVSNARALAARYWTAETWPRRRWKRLLTWPWAERKRCAWPADLKRFICRSRRRVGRCETLWGGRRGGAPSSLDQADGRPVCQCRTTRVDAAPSSTLRARWSR
jgi:hypothetical protein